MKLRHSLISIPADGIWLDGSLAHAPDVRGLAIVVQPGASQATHRREADIAAVLQEAGFATLTLDLLTRHEEQRDPDAGFNVARLTERILAAVDWIDHQPPLSALPTGLLASGTASAAVIRAAVKSPARFGALVCLAGRPDLAGANPLRSLRVPTLFVVGREDPGTAIQRQAFEMIPGVREWHATGGAEPEHVGRQELATSTALAAQWFTQKLPAAPSESADELPPAGSQAPATPHPTTD
ncbi:MAG: alpha/beta hydrolase [Azoarcus sp.]|nr:alpha/beta hydrolase [Azoarcus sp.]